MPEILVFTADSARYGVDAAVVQEVVRAVAIAPLPGAPPIIEGVFNLRGSLTPLLDVRSRFGHPAKPVQLSDRFIVVRAGRRTVALHVDTTEALATLTQADVADIYDVVPDSKWIAGTASLPDGLVLIHDIETFLSSAESGELDAALNTSGGRE